MRFYGRTTAHSRLMNFKTWDLALIGYLQSGIDNADLAGLKQNFRALDGHNTNLPMTTGVVTASQGDLSAVNALFYEASTPAYWSMNYPFNVWGMDDGSSYTDASTHHTMWVRAPRRLQPGALVGHMVLVFTTLSSLFPFTLALHTFFSLSLLICNHTCSC